MDVSGKLFISGLDYGDKERLSNDTMEIEKKLETVFSSDLRYLTIVSYIVLGNNAVTNRFIEKTYNMPVHAWSALLAIAMFPGIRAKEIVQLFPRPQNTVSRAASLLEARGLIRHETSVEDGREKCLYATSEGELLLKEIREASVERQKEIFSPLTEEELEQFFQLAKKIADGPLLLRTAAMKP